MGDEGSGGENGGVGISIKKREQMIESLNRSSKSLGTLKLNQSLPGLTSRALSSQLRRAFPRPEAPCL